MTNVGFVFKKRNRLVGVIAVISSCLLWGNSWSHAAGEGEIAFTSQIRGDNQIFLINADGSNLSQITDTRNSTSHISLAWSPDGKKLAFHLLALNEPELEGLYIMNTDGSERTLILPGLPSHPSWSPDGRQFVFFDGSTSLFIANTDGTNPQFLISGGQPAWSPDGSQVLYVSALEEGEQDVFVVNIDGSNPRRLTSPPSFNSFPAWSPDGSRIAYAAEQNRNSDIWVMNADGSNPIRLTSHLDHESSPAWSPDGTRIAFERGPDIWVMNVDGTNPMQLTNDGNSNNNPIWCPLSASETVIQYVPWGTIKLRHIHEAK